MNQEYTCPCCGFFVFCDPPGSNDICSICGWEDDHVQLQYPALSGGANSESLYACQVNAIEDYPIDVMEVKGIGRDPEWRPLRTLEVVGFSDEPRGGMQYSEGDDSAEYYWNMDG